MRTNVISIAKEWWVAAMLLLTAAIMPLKADAQYQVEAKGDPLLTQYWAMPTYLNPAATGDIDFIRVRAAGRIEFLGSHASPKNYLLTGDSPFKLFGKRIGAGLVVNSQSYDLFQNLQVGAQGSYKLSFKKSTLSIGVQLGYYHSKFKGSEFNLKDLENSGNDEEGGEGENPDSGSGGGFTEQDYEIPTNDVKGGVFDVGVGIKFEHPKFHVALSAMHLTNPKVKLTENGETTTDIRYMESKLPLSLYFDAGGNIAIKNSLISLQPSLLVGSDFKKIDGLAELRATYNGKVTFGFNYRYNRAAGVMAAIAIKNFFLGYSWEYDYSASPKGSTGNHEIVLGYQFKMDLGGKNMFSHRSIRIM